MTDGLAQKPTLTATSHMKLLYSTRYKNSLHRLVLRTQNKKCLLTKGWVSKVESINSKPSDKYRQKKSNIKFLTIPVHHNICMLTVIQKDKRK